MSVCLYNASNLQLITFIWKVWRGRKEFRLPVEVGSETICAMEMWFTDIVMDTILQLKCAPPQKGFETLGKLYSTVFESGYYFSAPETEQR